MRKWIGAAVAVALLAVALGGVVRTATAAAPATTEITVVVRGDAGAGTELDFNHDGLTQGDRIVFRGPLFDPAETHRVGRMTGECVVVSNRITATDGLWRCSYMLELAGGDLVVEGLDPRGEGSSVFAILGGTVDYATASGDADVVDIANRTEFHLHVEI